MKIIMICGVAMLLPVSCRMMKRDEVRSVEYCYGVTVDSVAVNRVVSIFNGASERFHVSIDSPFIAIKSVDCPVVVLAGRKIDVDSRMERERYEVDTISAGRLHSESDSIYVGIERYTDAAASSGPAIGLLITLCIIILAGVLVYRYFVR